MAIHFRQVAIIGVGLIGGSLGMVLKQSALADRVVGVGRRPENLRTAVTLGAIDWYTADPAEAVRAADLIVLATPVDSYEAQFKEWGAALSEGAIVTDVGSVKGPLVTLAERLLPAHVHFVGGHPIAGREKTGVAAGSVQLFRGARCILTPTSTTDPAALTAIRDMWEAAGSVVMTMDPAVHDRVLGAVSHLPHVAAFALINALVDVETEVAGDTDLLAYAGGGLKDTTRIAASSPEMWRDIFLWNRDNVVSLIERYERRLLQLKRLIADADGLGIEKELELAKRTRERLTTS